METRKIGSLDVSLVGLGCNNFGMRIDAAATDAVVGAALDAGITYFDTADIYGGGESEVLLGRALGDRRGDVVVASKFGGPSRLPEGRLAGEPSWVREACDRSLRALGMDYIDHMQLHYPDAVTPQAETLAALDGLVKAGKVRQTGCSNFTEAMLDEAASISTAARLTPYASVQNHYSLLTRTAEHDGVLAACARNKIAFVPFFPLESGVLSGKYSKGAALPEGSRLAAWGEMGKRFINDERLDAVARLTDLAGSSGHTILELAMSWLATNPQVASIIAGATTPAQIRANAAAASAWKMTPGDLAAIETALSSTG